MTPATNNRGMNRGIIVAVAVFAALLFIVIGTRNSGDKAGVKELKLEKLDKEQVTKVEITIPQKDPHASLPDAGPTAAKEPRHAVLEKAGEAWKVYDPAKADAKFDVDEGQLRSVLDAVNELKAGDMIANKAEKLKDLELDDDSALVVKITAAGKATELMFGRAAKGGGTAMRMRGSNDVFVGQGRLGSLLKKDVAQWRKKVMIDVRPDEIAQVSVAVAADKDKPAEKYLLKAIAPPAEEPAADAGAPATPPKIEWTIAEPAQLPAGFRVDSAALGRIATSFATLRAVDFADGVADDAAGIGADATTVSITMKDGKTKAVRFGKEDDKKRIYAKVDGDPQVYVVAQYTVKNVAKRIDELRDLSLFTAKIEDVEKVTFTSSSGTVIVKKDGADWKLVEPKTAPPEFDATQIAGQVSAVLRMKGARVDLQAPASAMAKAGPTVELLLKGGKKQSLRFGAGLPVDKPAEKPEAKGDDKPREHWIKGGADDLTYVIAAYTRNRYDKPTELFKKPPPPPQGMGGGMGGLDKLPPDVRKKLEASLKQQQQQ